MIGEEFKILHEVSPAEIWQRAQAHGRQFLLVGDTNHAEYGIIEALAAGIPALAAAGFRHLGTENDFGINGQLYSQQHQAGLTNEQRDAGLQAHFQLWRTSHLPYHDAQQQGHIAANFSLLSNARNSGMHVYALNNREPYGAFAMRHGATPLETERLAQAREAHFNTRRIPAWLAPDERTQYERIDDLYSQENLLRDGERSAMLMAMARTERAVMFYGSRHFRRQGGGCIASHLPKNQQVFVMLGAAETLRERFTGFSSLVQGLPDYAIETDTKRGLVLSRAAALR